MLNDINLIALEERITDYCLENQISGVLRITLRDRVVLQQTLGLANVKENTPFTDRSMFTFYSLSKPFCVIGLMLLKDAGKVDLTLHPSTYIPEARGLDERVSIKQMLHHISGLPDFEQNAEFVKTHSHGYPEQLRAQLKELVDYPQYFAPGSAAMYANINMILPALIVENLSRLSYAEYMQKFVFAPLGMRTAIVDCQNQVVPERVQGYDLINGVKTEVERVCDWSLGAGDIVGTVDDVYALNRAIKHRLLLREDTWREILTPSPLNDMGMGCRVTGWHGKKRITHNGGHRGFRTLHIQLPEDDFDIIFLSNSGYGNARHDIAEMIHAAFYGEDGSEQTIMEMDKGYI